MLATLSENKIIGELNKKGFLDFPIDPTLDLIAAINSWALVIINCCWEAGNLNLGNSFFINCVFYN